MRGNPVLGRQVSAAWRQDRRVLRPRAGPGSGLGGQDPGSRAPGAALGRPGGRDPKKPRFLGPRSGPEEGVPARFWDPNIAIFRVLSAICRKRPKSGTYRKRRIFGGPAPPPPPGPPRGRGPRGPGHPGRPHGPPWGAGPGPRSGVLAPGRRHLAT
jgi:hypothetical protein